MKIRMKEDCCGLKKDKVYELLHICRDDGIYIVLDSYESAVHVSNTRCELIEELPIEPLINQIKCEQQPNQFYPSRRDYFAACVLNALLSNPTRIGSINLFAKDVIQYADEMIRQLDESENK